MSRYYTLCETTPGLQSYKQTWRRIYREEPGYLFHDTDEPLAIESIRKPLWRLSKLYDDAKHVICVRVDPNTIMGTFSTAALPRPVKVTVNRGPANPVSSEATFEYLQKDKLAGWLIEDIQDPTTPAQALQFNDLYDECLKLERLMGVCPCPRIEEGTCLTETAFLKVPWLANRTSYSLFPDTAPYKNKTYQKLDDFEFVSGQTTSDADFIQTVRPWNNYDFSLVPLRRKQFSERGQENSRRGTHRKEACSQCVFGTKVYSGGYKDCGRIKACDRPSTDKQVWDVLKEFLRQSPYINGDEGFTPGEIEYLISVTGEEHPSRAVTAARTIETVLAGFRWTQGRYGPSLKEQQLSFRVAPVRGSLDRSASLHSYAKVREHFPFMPSSDTLNAGRVSQSLLLIYAVLSTWTTIAAEAGHQPHAMYKLHATAHGVDLYGHTTRSSFIARSLSVGTCAEDVYNTLWPYTQEQVHVRQNNLNYNVTVRAQNLGILQPLPQVRLVE